MLALALLKHLQLLQLADSALPIGSLAHSFGLESMTAEGHVSLPNIYSYLGDLLEESLLLEAVFCRSAHGLIGDPPAVQNLNERLSALRIARESRMASLAIGRRFLSLVQALEPCEIIAAVLARDENHLCVAFGLSCGLLGLDVEQSVAAFLHQSVLNIISAAQRLIAFGQLDATRIAWDLKPNIDRAVRKSATGGIDDVCCFAHLPELASMRHPTLTTRLFIS
jgi:urease accessory protein